MAIDKIESPNKPCLYFAAPLFSEAERSYNKKVASQLELFFDVFLPQENGGLFVDMIADGMKPSLAARTVFDIDLRALEKCDILLILLDGRTVDEGAAFELGIAYAKGKRCYGLQTDVRRLLPNGNNPMLEISLESIFASVEELIGWAQSFTGKTITRGSCVARKSR